MDNRELDKMIALEVMEKNILSIIGAVEGVINSRGTLFLENGIFIDREHTLVFDKKEHDKKFSSGYYIPHYQEWLNENSEVTFEPQPYSTDIECAFEVVEKLREKYRVDLKIENNTCFCTILDYKGLRYDASNKHIATVICLAALKIDSIGG